MKLNGVKSGLHFNIYRRDRGGWEYMSTRRSLAPAQRYASAIGSPANVMIRPVLAGRLGRVVSA